MILSLIALSINTGSWHLQLISFEGEIAGNEYQNNNFKADDILNAEKQFHLHYFFLFTEVCEIEAGKKKQKERNSYYYLDLFA